MASPRTGDPSAEDPVAVLFTAHDTWLRRWLDRRLGCTHQAADLAQDTFVLALMAPESHGLREPRAFLTVLAKRVLYNFWRRRDIERAYLDALASLPAVEVPSQESCQQVREAIVALDRVLGELPGPVRSAFLMNRVEGRTQPEIARSLGMSLATVERHIRQAYLHCLLHADLADEGR